MNAIKAEVLKGPFDPVASRRWSATTRRGVQQVGEHLIPLLRDRGLRR